MLLRREGDALCRAADFLPELHLHLQQHVPHACQGGLHAGPDLQRLIVSAVLELYLFDLDIIILHMYLCHHYKMHHTKNVSDTFMALSLPIVFMSGRNKVHM